MDNTVRPRRQRPVPARRVASADRARRVVRRRRDGAAAARHRGRPHHRRPRHRLPRRRRCRQTCRWPPPAGRPAGPRARQPIFRRRPRVIATPTAAGRHHPRVSPSAGAERPASPRAGTVGGGNGGAGADATTAAVGRGRPVRRRSRRFCCPPPTNPVKAPVDDRNGGRRVDAAPPPNRPPLRHGQQARRRARPEQGAGRQPDGPRTPIGGTAVGRPVGA